MYKFTMKPGTPCWPSALLRRDDRGDAGDGGGGGGGGYGGSGGSGGEGGGSGVVRLLRISELSLCEAAAQSDQSIGSLKVACHRALKSLKRALEGKDLSHE